MYDWKSVFQSLNEIGVVIGETTPFYALFLARRPARVGEYVIIEHDEGPILAMVEQSISGNPFIPSEVKDIDAVEKTIQLVGTNREYLRGRARLLSKLKDLIEHGKPNPLKTPPRAGNKVYEASEEILRKAFAPDSPNSNKDLIAYVGEKSKAGYVRIGVLANHPTVPVYVKVDSIVARHIAILAVTGAGKSNTVSILAERMVSGLGGTVLIFDMHGEYAGSNIGGGRCNVIEPKLNPEHLTFAELKTLAKIKHDAVRQERVLRLAFNAAKLFSSIKRSADLIERMLAVLEVIYKLNASKQSKSATENGILEEIGENVGGVNVSEEDKGELKRSISYMKGIDSDPVFAVMNKLEELKAEYGSVIDSRAPHRLESIIKPGYVNIVNLAEIDERGSDVIVSFFLRRLLQERKKYVITGEREGYPSPILVVLEEAHILIPRGEETFTKATASRIAREGRKFGIGLCLVSQRPKGIDENALSQTNNKIILKIVEPQDKYYVQRASEQLSDELLELLPSLNVGEAVLLGEMTILPALVKIDEHPKKIVGRDVKIALEWQKVAKREEEIIREIGELLEMQEG